MVDLENGNRLERNTGTCSPAYRPQPCVTKDLNPNNLVFNIRDGQPELIGILDFESAWASTGESDLARLEFWWMTAGTAIRQGYSEVADVAAEYMMRKPLLRLLWCLEYAEHHASVEHQALTSGVCAELGLPEIQLG